MKFPRTTIIFIMLLIAATTICWRCSDAKANSSYESPVKMNFVCEGQNSNTFMYEYDGYWIFVTESKFGSHVSVSVVTKHY